MQTMLVLAAALFALSSAYSTTMSMSNMQNGNCRIMNGMLYDGSSTRQLTSSETQQVQNYMNMMGGSQSGYNSGYGSTGYNTGYGSSGYGSSGSNMGYGSSSMYGTGYGTGSGYNSNQYNPSGYTGSTANGYNTNGYYNPSSSSSGMGYNSNGMMYSNTYGNNMGSSMANMPCLCRQATCASN
ncbi:unnamed protein product, partial [Mesorhabditis belari]|uniref:Uncharacterized protein n=1 Tax=Mesorhabditis belari TaxID=2138241 RepID=A0AAF3JBW9_9BILA